MDLGCRIFGLAIYFLLMAKVRPPKRFIGQRMGVGHSLYSFLFFLKCEHPDFVVAHHHFFIGTSPGACQVVYHGCSNLLSIKKTVGIYQRASFGKDAHCLFYGSTVKLAKFILAPFPNCGKRRSFSSLVFLARLDKIRNCQYYLFISSRDKLE